MCIRDSFYKISEINKEKDKINIEKGKRVRVHGGPFDQVGATS